METTLEAIRPQPVVPGPVISKTLRVATMVVRHVLVVETAQTICSEQAKAYLVLAGDRVLER